MVKAVQLHVHNFLQPFPYNALLDDLKQLLQIVLLQVRTTNSSRNQHTSPLEDYSSKQLVLPASQDEMNNYESHLSSTSHYTLSISLPTINIHIPSKEFLEALYNRVAVDLALWQPASPAAVEKATARSVFYSSADILQPALTKDDKFKLCKSVLRGTGIPNETTCAI